MKLKVVIVIVAVLLLIAAGFAFWQLKSLAGKTIINNPEPKEESYVTIEDKLKHKKPFSILLLGYAGGKHDGTYLTDSLMVARIDPATKNVYLLSIPRDTWVALPTADGTPRHWKINAAYQIGLDDKGYPNKLPEFKGEAGGANLAKYAASQVTGQPIDGIVAIDFAGFKNTIDTLGGIDIEVETTFDDFAYPLDVIPDESCGHSPEDIEKFTATVSAEPLLWEYFSCRYKHLHFDKGLTHMDGTTALEYVRSRHSAVDGSDFGRAKRQRNLLLAVKQKILSAGFIPKIIPFVESLGNDLKTDISLTDIKAIIQNINELGSYQIHTYALTDKNYLNITTATSGASILAPKAGIDTWTNIHEWVADIYSGKPEKVPMIVRVENGTKTSGLAIKATQTLQGLSILTVDPINSKVKTEKTSVIVYNKNIQTEDINKVLKAFNVPSATFDTHTTDEYSVSVILGDDYAKSLSSSQ